MCDDILKGCMSFVGRFVRLLSFVGRFVPLQYVLFGGRQAGKGREGGREGGGRERGRSCGGSGRVRVHR